VQQAPPYLDVRNRSVLDPISPSQPCVAHADDFELLSSRKGGTNAGSDCEAAETSLTSEDSICCDAASQTHRSETRMISVFLERSLRTRSNLPPPMISSAERGQVFQRQLPQTDTLPLLNLPQERPGSKHRPTLGRNYAVRAIVPLFCVMARLSDFWPRIRADVLCCTN
jgi:hypothetical protein